MMPVAKSLSVGVIGAGPGGLALGIFLRKAGFRDFTIFDREDGVGGTWRINTYPGLACDVKSHLYSYSFDLNANWSRLWSGQPEILEYFERCADTLPARPEPEAEHRGRLRPVGCRSPDLAGDHVGRRAVHVQRSGVGRRTLHPAGAAGPLEEEPFSGTVMHTASWDHSVDLRRCAGGGAGYRVDRVAAGARGRQGGAHVYSVQRSPTWILPKPDRAYTDREKWVFAHVPFAKKFYRTRLWLRSESNISVIENGSDKTQEFKSIALRVSRPPSPTTSCASRLTPDHPFGCKRLVFATDYLQTLTQPHVEVVSSPARLCGRGRWSPRTAPSSTSMSWCAPPGMPPPTTSARSTSSARTARRCTRHGATARTPTSAWPFRASRTSSCCTDPTPTSAPTASSSCWRRRPATSCAH